MALLAEISVPGRSGRFILLLMMVVSPAGSQDRLVLRQLMDVDRFDAMMAAFSRLTGITFALGDADGTIVSQAGWQEACTRFHRVCPATRRRCEESDRFIAAHLHESPFTGYRCLNGLMDYAAPVVVEGRHAGTIFTGQFFHEPPDEDTFRQLAREHGFDEAAYIDAIRRVPVIGRDRVTLIMEFFSGVARMLAESGAERLRLREAELRSEAQIEKLRQSEEMFRAVFQNNAAAIAIMDPDLTIAMVNDAYTQISGYSNEDLAGKGWTSLVTPAGPESLDEYTRGAVQDPGGAPTRREFSLHARDGTEKSCVTSISSVPALRKIVASFFDVTERKSAEEALRESEQRLQFVVQGSRLGFWDWNLETNEVKRNERWAEMLGYRLDEIEFTVKQWIDFVHPDDQTRVLQSIQDHVEGRTPMHRLEYRMRAKDGQYRWILDQARVVKRDTNNRAIRMCGTHTDVTGERIVAERVRELNAELELRVAERTAQLTRAVHELESFAYTLAHDFKAPLRAIDGFAAILEENLGDTLDDNSRECIRKVRRGALSMAHLITGLLEYSGLERRETTTLSLDVHAIAEKVLGMWGERIRSEGSIVGLRTAGARVKADPVLLELVLRSLLDNALKFHLPGAPAQVTISALSAGNGRTAITVRDEGIGFEMQYRDRIFEVFHRLGRSEEYPGTGLGLALVQRAVRRMGGTVSANSAPGAGAAFTVELPS